MQGSERGQVRAGLALAGVWAVLLAGVLVWPARIASPDPGAELTRHTIWLALVFYGLAGVGMLWPGPSPWARVAWTLAWVTYGIHVALAFHHYHHWSHAEAMEHVRRSSGFGPGIFFSHLFTAVWGADVLSWWLWPSWHARRPRWLTILLHGYLAFIIFNATVVFGQGVSRWLGVVVLGTLGTLWLIRPKH